MEVINFNDKEFEKNVLIKYFTSGDQADIYLYYEKKNYRNSGLNVKYIFLKNL